MKVIFLDIDGVLNFDDTEARLPDGCLGIAEAPLKKLKKIVHETGARIVLSSSWRKFWAINDEIFDGIDKLNNEYLVKKLGRHGLHIMDKIGGQSSSTRYQDIKDYLACRSNISHYVVLDDEVFEGYMLIQDHLVITNHFMGLTDDDVELAIRILNGHEE